MALSDDTSTRLSPLPETIATVGCAGLVPSWIALGSSAACCLHEVKTMDGPTLRGRKRERERERESDACTSNRTCREVV